MTTTTTNDEAFEIAIATFHDAIDIFEKEILMNSSNSNRCTNIETKLLELRYAITACGENI